MRVIGVVENMSGEVFGSGGGAALAAEIDAPLLGCVPLDPALRASGDVGEPAVLAAPDSAAALAIVELAEAVGRLAAGRTTPDHEAAHADPLSAETREGRLAPPTVVPNSCAAFPSRLRDRPVTLKTITRDGPSVGWAPLGHFEDSVIGCEGFACHPVGVQWRDADWLKEADAWIRAQVGTPTGAVTQPHVRPWATVMKVPTAEGVLWFKANGPASRFEAALDAELAARFPDLVGEVVAVDSERGWMLLRDAGTRLRELEPDAGQLACWEQPAAALRRAPARARGPVRGARRARRPRPAPRPSPGAARRAPRGRDRAPAGVGGRPDRGRAGIGARGSRRFRCALRRAGRAGHRRDPAARRPPRRSGLRAGRLPPDPRLGRQLRLAPVPHARRDLARARLAPRAAAGGPPLERLRDAYLEPFTRVAPRDDLVETARLAHRTGTLARALAWYGYVRAPDRNGDLDLDDAASVPYGLKLYLADGPIGTWEPPARW